MIVHSLEAGIRGLLEKGKRTVEELGYVLTKQQKKVLQVQMQRDLTRLIRASKLPVETPRLVIYIKDQDLYVEVHWRDQDKVWLQREAIKEARKVQQMQQLRIVR